MCSWTSTSLYQVMYNKLITYVFSFNIFKIKFYCHILITVLVRSYNIILVKVYLYVVRAIINCDLYIDFEMNCFRYIDNASMLFTMLCDYLKYGPNLSISWTRCRCIKVGQFKQRYFMFSIIFQYSTFYNCILINFFL